MGIMMNRIEFSTESQGCLKNRNKLYKKRLKFKLDHLSNTGSVVNYN